MHSEVDRHFKEDFAYAAYINMEVKRIIFKTAVQYQSSEQSSLFKEGKTAFEKRFLISVIKG